MKPAKNLDPEIMVHLASLKEKNREQYEEYIKEHPELR